MTLEVPTHFKVRARHLTHNVTLLVGLTRCRLERLVRRVVDGLLHVHAHEREERDGVQVKRLLNPRGVVDAEALEGAGEDGAARKVLPMRHDALIIDETGKISFECEAVLTLLFIVLVNVLVHVEHHALELVGALAA